MINIVIIEKKEELIKELKEHFFNTKCIRVLFSTDDGVKGLNYILENYPKIDVLILDLINHKKDGISILKHLRDKNIIIPVIVCSYCCSDIMIRKASEYNIKSYLLKPYNIIDLEILIKDSFNEKISNCFLETKILEMMHSLGISSKYKGYKYLKDAILLQYYHPEYKLSKDIYLKISTKNNVCKSNVERSISRAIDIGFSRSNYDDIEHIFGNTVSLDRGSPTNLEFIETIVERLNTQK